MSTIFFIFILLFSRQAIYQEARLSILVTDPRKKISSLVDRLYQEARLSILVTDPRKNISSLVDRLYQEARLSILVTDPHKKYHL